MRRATICIAATVIAGLAAFSIQAQDERRLYRCGDGKQTSYVSTPTPQWTCVGIGKNQATGSVVRDGVVYSYNVNGVRHYRSTPPPNGIEFRAIPYKYREGMRKSPQTAAALQPRTFRGYACTSDCSGHQAGYAWADKRGIEHPDECSGRSQSFIEGCEAFGHEAQIEMIEAGECRDEDQDDLCD